MPEILITDLSHFLAAGGTIGPESGAARELAEFLTEIVAAATLATSAPTTMAVKCRQRVGRKICGGPIAGSLDATEEVIDWSCPRCETRGEVRGWEGTLWDLTAGLAEH
ncbi:MAG: hypothetical protein SF066_23630 [Thermoanaerobaculia bacterium]|nr:hypothetical protein [Thermoanaerobaculia bacterium]